MMLLKTGLRFILHLGSSLYPLAKDTFVLSDVAPWGTVTGSLDTGAAL